MVFRVAKEGTLIPKWNGNDKLPTNEQIKVRFRYLTSAEREACLEDPKTSARRFFDMAVIEISGLNQEIDGKEVEVKTADDVTNGVGLYDLYMEIALAMLQANARKDLKN